MDTRILGRSGLEVTTLALGTMMFGAWGNTDADECHRMVHRAIDAGITLIDTADMYDAGVSEEILGVALRGHRDRIVLATKCGNPMDGDMSRSGLSARWVAQACDDSLRRLGVDHIDLYQMHRPDPTVPYEETLAAFEALITAGKIGAYGTSTFSPEQIAGIHDAALAVDMPLPTSEQPPYSALARGIETAVLPACRAADLGVIVWAPLNGGWLTGKYQGANADPTSRANRQGDHFDAREAAEWQAKHDAVDALTTIAADAGLTLTQLAIGFVLDDPTITSAIIGPRTLAQLDDLLAAGTPTLPAGVRDAIDAVIAPGANINPRDAG
ncbi:MAG: aldo-keto reductase [Ilumatobacteraceae bacterium]|nr:aldo-keto reductase [Ilumatobacteraceae bacterium]